MEQFKKDISFISKIWDEPTVSYLPGEITKTATFLELNRTDKSQHKLHFKIISVFEHFGVKEGEEGTVKIDSDGLYDLTVKAINTLLVPDPVFTVQDKGEFLNDSAAILNFGMWLLGEKIAPFFSKFNNS